MKASILIVPAVLLAGLVQSALAVDDAYAERPLSRAEVIADLQIWRESGMAALHQGDEPALFSPRYAEVSARYAAMHASPAFAALVRRIAAQRGEAVNVATTE